MLQKEQLLGEQKPPAQLSNGEREVGGKREREKEGEREEKEGRGRKHNHIC